MYENNAANVFDITKNGQGIGCHESYFSCYFSGGKAVTPTALNLRVKSIWIGKRAYTFNGIKKYIALNNN